MRAGHSVGSSGKLRAVSTGKLRAAATVKLRAGDVFISKTTLNLFGGARVVS